jgi:von Willebrand factor type A C-terminal domain/von Willebrand factor type A domain
MPTDFKAEVFQNQYLPAGAGEVHAIMTVTAAQDVAVTPQPSARLFGILCDVSGSMEGGKIEAAKAAMAKIVQLLPEDSRFFIVTGSHAVHLVAPVAPANAGAKQRALSAIRAIRADGGTTISAWLQMALVQFRNVPGAVRQALLLTDGQNDKDDAQALEAALAACEGQFQCDCRGVGTDWEVQQLRRIAGKLLGTTDIIPSPDQIEADFRAILEKALAKTVSDVFLRLWTPQGANVKFCKEVSPEIVDLTTRARQTKPQIREYPTGAWGRGESRDFHFCIEVQPGAVGDEVLAGRASLVHWLNGAENKVAEARILAVWTDDEAKSTKIDHVVAHYTGQAELAQSIQDGLEARAKGDVDKATALLGKAVKIAHDSGNEATAKLLRTVVDVQDAGKGTVRLKSSVSKEDAMALETRSTKTARIAKTS